MQGAALRGVHEMFQGKPGEAPAAGQLQVVPLELAKQPWMELPDWQLTPQLRAALKEHDQKLQVATNMACALIHQGKQQAECRQPKLPSQGLKLAIALQLTSRFNNCCGLWTRLVLMCLLACTETVIIDMPWSVSDVWLLCLHNSGLTSSIV